MRFSINSRVLEHLGKDLITSDEIAITELVKNSFDAKADKVKIHLIEDIGELSFNNFISPVSKEILTILKTSILQSQQIMVIEDDGDGMSFIDLEKGFFTIGTDIKKTRKRLINPDNERLPLGEKGIGRLAAQRLSKIMFLETASLNCDQANVVKIDWQEFMNNGATLEQIEMDNFEIPKQTTKYTRLWFVDLNFQFDSLITDRRQRQLSLFEDEESSEPLAVKENLLSPLSFLLSPFEEESEDFGIEIFFNEEIVSFSFSNEVIRVAESEHYFCLEVVNEKIQLHMNMQLKPWYLERIHHRLVGKDLFSDWRKTPFEYKELLEKYKDKYHKSLYVRLDENEVRSKFKNLSFSKLVEIGPISGRIYSFKRLPLLSAMAINSAKENGDLKHDYKIRNITNFLEAHNGIKLYRGKYRVTTLGDKESDWLHLQQARTKGQQFFRLELGNVIGYVKIQDPYQDFVKETSSRLNLADNAHSSSLFSFLKQVFNDELYSFSQAAFYITREILLDENLIPTRPLEKLKEKVEDADREARSSEEQLKQFGILLEQLESVTDSTDTNVETGGILKSLSKAGAGFKSILENTFNQIHQSKILVKQVENEKELIELESYNNYKLMANGLVTEVLTHELHSILSNIKTDGADESHFKVIENYLLEQMEYELISNHMLPIQDQTNFLLERVKEMEHFYTFMEKTFLYNGTIDDFEEEKIHEFILNLVLRLENRLKKGKITVDSSTINMNWIVPKGVLVHIFYNLMDNSLYWIKERHHKLKYDKSYYSSRGDYINFEKKDENTIYYSDSGTGVSARMENTLFQPLESGKDNKGRGMGLYIVRQLMRSFGGDIELLPTRNQYGNRFIFAIYLNSEVNTYGVEE